MKSGYLLCLLEPSIHHNHRIDFHINAAEGRGLMLGISFETCGVFLTSQQFREFRIPEILEDQGKPQKACRDSETSLS